MRLRRCKKGLRFTIFFIALITSRSFPLNKNKQYHLRWAGEEKVRSKNEIDMISFSITLINTGLIKSESLRNDQFNRKLFFGNSPAVDTHFAAEGWVLQQVKQCFCQGS